MPSLDAKTADLGPVKIIPMMTKSDINNHGYALTNEQDQNLDKLVICINMVLAAYKRPMVVTSGVRSMEDQLRINPKAPKSKHLVAAAVDILDTTGDLNNWCKANEAVLEQAGLWLEQRQGNWQHFQCLPYGSWKPGKTRFFIP